MTDLALLPLMTLAPQLAARTLSPVELTQHLLDRIATLDSRFHSYVTVMADTALAQAKQAEAEIAAGNYRGPLHGIPIAVKDLCFTPEAPSSCGSQMFRDYQPADEATVVSKLRAAGAILLGKLHMTEFALRWHHPYRPIPVNPWGADRWPGVSSSGSGVATATGLCYGAIGTDTGGSIRFPAACNGVVGLKPTYGRVSRAGVFALAASLDNVGPLTRSVADAAAMLQAMAGYDERDPTSSRCAVPDYVALLQQGVAGGSGLSDPRGTTGGECGHLCRGGSTAIFRRRDCGSQRARAGSGQSGARLVCAHRRRCPGRPSRHLSRTGG